MVNSCEEVVLCNHHWMEDPLEVVHDDHDEVEAHNYFCLYIRHLEVPLIHDDFDD